jgi:hypothetical protein
MLGPTYATFGNTTLSRGFDFTFEPGVTPSTCVLHTVPHVPNLPSVATLTLRTEGQSPLIFPECHLGEPSLQFGQQGHFWTLPIRDRRWKWDFAYIHGHWNAPQPDGSLVRERSPRDLAEILLIAMGETQRDVSRLPNITRPEVQWDGAHAATELDSLCYSLDCVVVLNPVTNGVEIWPVGEGSALPKGYTMGGTFAPVRGPQPAVIRAESAHTRFQAVFATEAVGQDTDGRWKPIDELSYKPTGGWALSHVLAKFENITGTYEGDGGRTLKKSDLALATVYRSYRITGLVPNGGWSPPLLRGTIFEPQSLRDLKLFSELAETEIGPDGGIRQLPAAVYAKHFRLEFKWPDSAIRRYDEVFGFDTETGIIHFHEPMLGLPEVGKTSIAATVQIKCSFEAGAIGVKHRLSRERATGAAWSSPTELSIQDLDQTPYFIYDETGKLSKDNHQTVETKLDSLLDKRLQEFRTIPGGTVTYEFLMPIAPDGLTQQVTWSGGAGRPATTTASQGQRHNRFLDSLKERRRKAEADEAAKQIKAIAKIVGPVPIRSGSD